MKYYFPTDITEDNIGAIERQIYFISEGIQTYKIKKENEKKYVEIVLNDDVDEYLIKQRLEEIVELEINHKNTHHNYVWYSDRICDWKYKDILDYLLEKDIVHIHGEGQLSYKQPLIDLVELFDNIFSNISKIRFSADENIFPTLLKTSVLKKVGYFDSFPNLLMFTLRLKNEVNNYYNFKTEYKEIDSIEKVTSELMKYLCVTDYSLPPTMCYYVYDMLSNKEMKNHSVTTKGKSFRYENKYCEPFKRLSDFTIRETVFLGERQYVKFCVNEYRRLATRVMDSLGIKGYCKSANDPFYLVDDYQKKIKAQNILGAKYELRANVNEEETIAVASFNLHGQFLAKRFNLFLDIGQKKYANTGCIGIGLERFLYSFIVQYGIEHENWPEAVRLMIKDKKKIEEFVTNL